MTSEKLITHKTHIRKTTDIGARLRAWGIERFGSINAFAKALGHKYPGGISQYFYGPNLPGNKLQAKLRALGADVEWIMTGVSAAEGGEQRRREDAKREGTRVYFWAPNGVSDETRKIYERLAEIISKVPPEDADKIEAIVKAYMKSVLKGKKDS